MIYTMVHPARESKQYVVSERDKAWLETKGWSQDKPAPVPDRQVAALFLPSPEPVAAVSETYTEAMQAPIKRKYKRKAIV